MGGKLNHLAPTVSDLEASEASFPAAALGDLGFTKAEDVPGAMTLWHHERDAFAANLWQPRSGGPAHDRSRPGLHHAAFDAASRDEVNALHELVVETGLDVLDPPVECAQHASGPYAVHFADSDGLKFELAFKPTLPD